MPELNGALWRKSSRSHEQGQCVELAQNLPGVSAVRDSKAPEQGALVFTKAQLQTFLTTVKSGQLDL
ncbi:DUF397 domain-containing protein [Saccharopolyspora spinosa]|uniref:Uncharacterized protein DUF397 n=1 Tax=Saccharopolyspora spinosa TaxID=60894 RepID=A0A2N3XQF6_SACSN|nr:DUF397 domain-containing protein [Saccharopolyspora spinosa]PKW12924.1 uncharacterized protein DUF397 [Saccharopolyspora spinosa]